MLVFLLSRKICICWMLNPKHQVHYGNAQLWYYILNNHLIDLPHRVSPVYFIIVSSFVLAFVGVEQFERVSIFLEVVPRSSFSFMTLLARFSSVLFQKSIYFFNPHEIALYFWNTKTRYCSCSPNDCDGRCRRTRAVVASINNRKFNCAIVLYCKTLCCVIWTDKKRDRVRLLFHQLLMLLLDTLPTTGTRPKSWNLFLDAGNFMIRLNTVCKCTDLKVSQYRKKYNIKRPYYGPNIFDHCQSSV